MYHRRRWLATVRLYLSEPDVVKYIANQRLAIVCLRGYQIMNEGCRSTGLWIIRNLLNEVQSTLYQAKQHFFGGVMGDGATLNDTATIKTTAAHLSNGNAQSRAVIPPLHFLCCLRGNIKGNKIL